MIRRLAAAFVVVASLASGIGPARAVVVHRANGDGLEAWLVEDHRNPILALRIVFRGGSALDPPGKEGLAAMAMALLDEGAGDLDSQAFQGRLEDHAIRLSFSADRDEVGCQLQTLTENRDEALRLLRLALTEPRFDEAAVERVRRQLQSAARQELENPEALARRGLERALFPDDAYGRPPRGTVESLGSITVDDLRGWARRRLAQDALVVGAAGDITPQDLARALPEAFGGLTAAAAPWARADVAVATSGGVVVEPLDVPQSAIAFGQRGVKRLDPDYYAAAVLNEVLGGGGLTSILFEEVRERRGLVYSVYTALNPMDHAATWIGGAAASNARAGETVALVREIWGRVARDGATDAEVSAAKTYLVGSFPLRFTSSAQVAGLLVSMQLDGLGIDYLDRRAGLFESVTTDQVNQLARNVLDPAKLAFVVAGKPAGLPSGR